MKYNTDSLPTFNCFYLNTFQNKNKFDLLFTARKTQSIQQIFYQNNIEHVE